MTDAGPANCEIDEPDAWALVRAARDAAIRTGDPALAISAGDNAATIDVMAGGDWQSGFAVSPSAARILDIYLPYAASGKSPTVLAQVGQSLDGFIATASGHSHYVTGEAGLDHLHRLRALSDVVVVGAGHRGRRRPSPDGQEGRRSQPGPRGHRRRRPGFPRPPDVSRRRGADPRSHLPRNACKAPIARWRGVRCRRPAPMAHCHPLPLSRLYRHVGSNAFSSKAAG